MPAALLDGKALAQTMQAELAAAVADFTRRTFVRPGLAAVLVGDRPDSRSYVTLKRKACEKVGIESWLYEMPASVTQSELQGLVSSLNDDRRVHGILVQMPLPSHLDSARIVDAVDPLKDADGFGPVSLGLLASGRPRFLACTPRGIIELMTRNGISVTGKRVAVAGRSTIVGLPMALILLLKEHNATVTVCHSRTPDLGAVTRQADVVIMAIGKPNTLRADMVKPGAVVIDVGTNRIQDPETNTSRWVGDVDFAGVSEVASAITPVPGGVGPMTVAMLLHNTLHAAQLQHS
jgi:methylenetetrahydrofolate dehydrogenase (NADP+)/methenyltetrahydrofolate cyclohydrolase